LVLVLAALCVWAARTRAEPEGRPDRTGDGLPPPVFAVSFDAGDAQADTAPANREAKLVTHGKCASELEFEPGRRGKGLLVGRDRPAVHYEPGRLPLTAGTWMAWFQPRGWTIGKGTRNSLFMFLPVEGRGYFGVQQCFEITPEREAVFGLWFSYFPEQRGNYVRYRASVADPDQWRLATLRWSGTRFWLSLDDGPAAEVRRPRPLRDGDLSGIVVLGSPFSTDRTVIDEVRIYDRRLSNEQVRQVWEGEAAGEQRQ